MPKIFGGLSYNNPTPLYVGQPVEEIKALQQVSDEKHKSNQDMYDKLDIALSNISVEDPDYQYKKAAVEKLKGTIADVTSTGRWETARDVVNKAAKDLATDKALRLAADVPRQKAEYEANLDKEFKDGKLGYTKDYIDRAKALSRASYKGVQKNPVTGEYEGAYGGFNPAKEVNVTKKAEEYAKGWLPDEVARDVKRVFLGKPDANGEQRWLYETKSGKTVEFADSKQINQRVFQALQDDTEVQSYYSSLNTLDDFSRSGRDVQAHPDLGMPAEYAADKKTAMAYMTFKKQVMENHPNATETQIANAFENATARHGQTTRAAGFAADKYGYIKEKITDEQGIKSDNPYELAGFKKKLEDQTPIFTSKIAAGGLASSLKTPGDIKNKINQTEQATNNVMSAAYQYVKDNNVDPSASKLIELAANGIPITREMFKQALDKNGVAHDGEMMRYVMEIQQNQKVRKETEEYEKRILAKAGLDPSVDFTYDGLKSRLGEDKLAETTAAYYRSLGVPSSAGIIKDMMSGKNGAAAQKEIVSAINHAGRELYVASPEGAKYVKLLEENAKDSQVDIGLTTFGSQAVENKLSDIILTDLNSNGLQGAKWLGGAKDGTTLGDEDDYSQIGDKKPTTVRFALKDGGIQLVFRPYDKAGVEMKDYVEMPAPIGVKEFLIKENRVNELTYDMLGQLDQVAKTENRTGQVYGYDVQVPFKSDKDKSTTGQGKYTVILPTAENPSGEMIQYNSSSELVKGIIKAERARILNQ